MFFANLHNINYLTKNCKIDKVPENDLRPFKKYNPWPIVDHY